MTDTWELVGSIRKSLTAIRDHYDATLNGPRRAGSVGGSGGSKEPPAPISLHIIEARRLCHADLLHYARAIQFQVTDVEGGQISTRLDGDDVLELTRFVDTWAELFIKANHADAVLCDKDMAEHAHAMEALALPDRRDWMRLGTCPLLSADDDGNPATCGGDVRAYDRYTKDDNREQFVECTECGTRDDLDWWMVHLQPESADLGHADEVIACVALRTRHLGEDWVEIKHDTLWKWGQRGVILTHGKDAKGRTLYSKAAVLAYATDKIKEDVA